MRIIPNSFAAFAFVTLAMIVTSCAKNVETETNVDPEGKAIGFSPLVGHTTRATEIKINNLGDFAVMARGLHPDGVLYNSYLIGSENGGEIAHHDMESGAHIWKLDRSVYWPSSTSRALFVAYTTLKSGESSEDGVLGGAKFEIPSKTDQPTIKGFEPSKASLTENLNNGVWADGKDQKDLLVAFQAHDRGTSKVPLNFRHALTQVSITANRKNMLDNDNRIVKVKGAWIVNAAKTGDLSATIEVDNTTPGFPVTNKTAWNAAGFETYGSYRNDGIPLTKNVDKGLLSESLMLIPQSLVAWDGNKVGDTSTDAETTTGAYIMLLCRVELEHSGTSHAGSDIKDIAIWGQNHYHQLFPVNTEQYDGAEYGFVCVPLSTDWADEVENSDDLKGMGKHYTYKLDICGQSSGAGYYPPIPAEGEDAIALVKKLIPDGAIENALVWENDKYVYKDVSLKVVTKRPADKKVGDPVLDEPILFDVDVNGWTNGSADIKF